MSSALEKIAVEYDSDAEEEMPSFFYSNSKEKVHVGKKIITVEVDRIRLNTEVGLTPDVVVERGFNKFISDTLKRHNCDLENTKFCLNLEHSGFREDKGFFLPSRTFKVLNGAAIVNMIEKMMTSNRNISLDQAFSVSMYIYNDVTPSEVQSIDTSKMD